MREQVRGATSGGAWGYEWRLTESGDIQALGVAAGMLAVEDAVNLRFVASEQAEYSAHDDGDNSDRDVDQGDGDSQDEDRMCDFDVIDVKEWTESIFFEHYFESHRPVLVKGFADAKWQRCLFLCFLVSWFHSLFHQRLGARSSCLGACLCVLFTYTL